MKVCITAEGKDLESNIDSRFGRCNCFIFIDTDTMNYEVVENPWKEASGGAGIQAAQMVVSKKLELLITGKLGPNAEQIINLAKIKVINKTGKVVDAIKEIKNK